MAGRVAKAATHRPKTISNPYSLLSTPRHRLAEAYPVGWHAVDDGVAALADLFLIAGRRGEAPRRVVGGLSEAGQAAQPALARPGVEPGGEGASDAASPIGRQHADEDEAHMRHAREWLDRDIGVADDALDPVLDDRR